MLDVGVARDAFEVLADRDARGRARVEACERRGRERNLVVVRDQLREHRRCPGQPSEDVERADR